MCDKTLKPPPTPFNTNCAARQLETAATQEISHIPFSSRWCSQQQHIIYTDKTRNSWQARKTSDQLNFISRKRMDTQGRERETPT